MELERPPWYPQSLLPFKSQALDVEGCRIHFIDQGQGPVLLMLHGNPTWSFLYREIIRGLHDKYRCIAPDYPGFGLSTPRPEYDFTPQSHAAVLERLVLELDLSEITMMVQDWGGPIGLAIAIRHPERFHRLVIGNTWAWPVNGDFHFEWFSRFMGGSVGRYLIEHFNLFVNALLPLGVKRHKIPPDVLAAYRGPFATRISRKPTHIFPRAILKSRPFLAEIETALPRIAQLPALVVWGDKDFAFRARERRRFEEIFPNHRTVMLRGAGHFIQEDAPQEIVEAISWT